MSYHCHTLWRTLCAIRSDEERPPGNALRSSSLAAQTANKQRTRGPSGKILGAALLPLALLVACAGGTDESLSEEPDKTTQTRYLGDVLRPAADTDSTDTPRGVSLIGQTPATGQQQEQQAMTVMVLDALHFHPGQRVPPPAELEVHNPATDTVLPPEPERFFFAFDTSELSVRDQSLLSAHARFLKARPDYRLHISGHTDATGPDGYNRRLSYRRAQTVAVFLQGKGVDPKQLRVSGHSSDCPLAEAGSAHQQRRVELSYQHRPPTLMSRQ